MLKAARLSKNILFSALLWLCAIAPALWAEDGVRYSKNDTSLYKDVFEANIYHEFTSYLRFDRLWNKLTGRKTRSFNVNLFDEVADSPFFTNRHAKTRLSAEALQKGYQEKGGPDLSAPFTIIAGKTEGLHPGFFVKDAKGDSYLIKFDPAENLQMATSGEIVASRLYYAIGYNVPEYNVVSFTREQLQPAPDAMTYDDSGFKKPLTQEKIDEYMIFVPQDEDGKYWASASKILAGENMGAMSIDRRRRNDPEDPWHHHDRREFRALQVFASWLNNYDVRESNTLEMYVEEDGRGHLKRYLIDFNAVFGSGTSEAKPPMFSHEHMGDYGQALKAFIMLGWLEKPWQKKWREAGENAIPSPAIGYFDNRDFDPSQFKTQLPYYAFKDVSDGDGFWAAKIISSFSDEDIQTIVKAGNYQVASDADYIAKMLIERRDIVAKYWYARVNPLDRFDLKNGELVFSDLAVDQGFEEKNGTMYHLQISGVKAGDRSKISETQSEDPAINLTEWLDAYDSLELKITTSRANRDNDSPYVGVEVTKAGIQGVFRRN